MIANTSTAAVHGASSVYADWEPVVEVDAAPVSDRHSLLKLTTKPDLTIAWAFLAADAGDLTWMDDADCASVDPELWQPRKNAHATEAKRICQGCPVRVQCLKYALGSETHEGVWGGLPERPRRQLRAASRRQGLVLGLDELEVVIEAYDAGLLADYLGPRDYDRDLAIDDEDDLDGIDVLGLGDGTEAVA